MKLLQNPCDNTRHTLGMLLHYLGKLKIQIFCKYSADIAEMQTYCILIASNFVVHPQILIFSVFKIANLSSYRFQTDPQSKSGLLRSNLGQVFTPLCVCHQAT